MNTIQFKQLRDGFILPKYATAGAGAFDLHALEDGAVGVWPSGRGAPLAKIPLGFAVAIPDGTALLLTARSGHGAKYGAGVPHGYGLIDSDYRGEVMLVLQATIPFNWKAGDRIGQAMLVPYIRANLMIVNELPGTERGEGGFGSTGV